MSNATQNHAGRSTLGALTALGSGQTTAFALLNNADHHFTTVASNTGAVLPPGRIPSSVTVFNAGASSLSVYPPVGGTINGGSVNAAITLTTLTGANLFAAGMLTWYTAATSSGSGGSGTVTSVDFVGDGTVLSSTPSTAVTTSGAVTATLATQAKNLVLAGPATGSNAAPTFRAIAAVDLPTVGLELDQTQSIITSDTDGATITFNLATSNWHTVTLGGNRTLALSGGVTGQQFTLVLVQDGTGSRTVTWFSGIKWAGGTAPTLTTTAAKADIFTFKQTGTGAYYGMVAGQNF